MLFPTPLRKYLVAVVGARWFHVWFLPSLWLSATVVLWVGVWLRHKSGELPTIAGLPILWLINVRWLPERWVVPAICAVGAAVMAAVGLAQDLLRVSKRVVTWYLLLPILLFIMSVVRHLGSSRPEEAAKLFSSSFLTVASENIFGLTQFLLVCLCATLYIIPILSCAFYFVAFLVRLVRWTFRRTAQRGPD